MIIPAIQQMTRIEKLQAFEALWQELSKPAEDYNSPLWHHDELLKSEAAVQSGDAHFVDWNDAKEQLRARAKY